MKTYKNQSTELLMIQSEEENEYQKKLNFLNNRLKNLNTRLEYFDEVFKNNRTFQNLLVYDKYFFLVNDTIKDINYLQYEKEN